MHTSGHFPDELEEVDRLVLEGGGATVELRNLAQLVDQADEPGARLLGLVDHLPLPIAERLIAVALEHPQVAADDRRRGAEFVNGQRQQPRVRLLQARAVVVPPSMERSTASGGRRPGRQLYEKCFRLRLIRIAAIAESSGNFPHVNRGTSLEVRATGSTEVEIMRKRYRVLMLAVLVAAIAVPLGFALSLEPLPTAVVAPSHSDSATSASWRPAGPGRHVALVQTSSTGQPALPALPDGAKLLFVGSALFGLAGVMRRTN